MAGPSIHVVYWLVKGKHYQTRIVHFPNQLNRGTIQGNKVQVIFMDALTVSGE